MDRLLQATARAERDHFWFRGFRRFVEPLVADAARGKAPLTILDCGCGTGHNLTLLRRYGRAFGIDLTWSGLARARRAGDRQLARASATCLPFPRDRFDLVTSFDVLYALDDEMEHAALDEMHRVLRPGGHLLVNVAAIKALTGNHSMLGAKCAATIDVSCGSISSEPASRWRASPIPISRCCRSSHPSGWSSGWPATGDPTSR